MNKQAKIWYDKESDFLEIAAEKKPGSFKALGNDVFERVDVKGRPIGIAVFNFLKRFEAGAGELPLPLSLTLKKAVV